MEAVMDSTYHGTIAKKSKMLPQFDINFNPELQRTHSSSVKMSVEMASTRGKRPSGKCRVITSSVSRTKDRMDKMISPRMLIAKAYPNTDDSGSSKMSYNRRRFSWTAGLYAQNMPQ